MGILLCFSYGHPYNSGSINQSAQTEIAEKLLMNLRDESTREIRALECKSFVRRVHFADRKLPNAMCSHNTRCTCKLVAFMVAITFVVSGARCVMAQAPSSADGNSAHVEYLRPSGNSTPSREPLPCSAEGWVTDSSDHRSGANQLIALPGNTPQLQWTLLRKSGSFNALARPVSMTGFRSIEFDVWSQFGTILIVPLDDLDGAKFNAPVKLDAGQWKHVKLSAGDFHLSDDSPVKKPTLSATRAGVVFSLADIGGVLGANDTNVIRFSNLFVEKEGFPVIKLPEIIDGKTVIIAENCKTKGDILIRNGGVLKITSKQIAIASNIKVENNATLAFEGSSVSFANRLPHDLTISARKNSVVSIKNCNSPNTVPTSLDLWEGSRLIIADTTFSGAGFTCGAPPGTSVTLNKVKAPGEFLFMPGSKISMTDCRAVLLWPWYIGPYKVDLKLPDGNHIDSWAMPASTGLDLKLKNCNEILWAMILDKGADVSLNNSKLRVVGLTLKGATHTLSNIRNRAPVSALNLTLGDRSLKLSGCTVQTWNFYPGEKTRARIDRCLFGEAMTFDDSVAQISNSECDGTGGYVASKGRSTLTLSECTLNCHVAAVDSSSLKLQKCKVNGPLTASGNATIELIDTTINGAINQLDKAKITRGK